MDKSKLPKPSQLRAPQIRILQRIPENQSNIPSLLPPRLKRRSKSVTDLREELHKPLRIRKNEALKAPAKPQEHPPVSTSGKTSAKLGQKRPAPTKEDPLKAKVPKQARVPNWDYKSRFNQLSEKYTKALESLKDKEHKLSDFAELDAAYSETKQELSTLQQQNQKLESDNINNSIELLQLRQAKCILDSEHNTLLNDHKLLKSEYNELVLKECNNKELISTLSKDKLELDDKVYTLTKAYDSLKHNYDILKSEYDKLRLEYDSQVREYSCVSGKLEAALEQTDSLKKNVSLMKKIIQENEVLRRNLHNTIQDLKGNIRVFCRIRPPINDIEQEKLQYQLNFLDEATVEIRKRESVGSTISGRPNEQKLEFSFDKVFPPESRQVDVFEELAQLVQSAVDGYHVCIFAYGQTGSGKTYTMQGEITDEQLGIIPRSVDLVFQTVKKLSEAGWSYSVQASFLEIYNEVVRDLLDPTSKQNYEIRFNEGKGTTVTNIRIEQIDSAADLKRLMTLAQNNRAVAVTDFNEHSSRSHAVTRIDIKGFNAESKISYYGSINLVDLAGSESAKTSSNERLVETKNINKSLSALGSVILALYNKEGHIPYRNSKLTYLLQSCLGGNSKTLMLVNISPFEENYGESINSLRFAAKVKEVKTGVKRNKSFVNSSATKS